jgi:hypothetical protein
VRLGGFVVGAQRRGDQFDEVGVGPDVGVQAAEAADVRDEGVVAQAGDGGLGAARGCGPGDEAGCALKRSRAGFALSPSWR